jgi:hypothetical protein
MNQILYSNVEAAYDSEGIVDSFQIEFNPHFPDGACDYVRGIRRALAHYYEIDLEQIEVVPFFENDVSALHGVYRIMRGEEIHYCRATL